MKKVINRIQVIYYIIGAIFNKKRLWAISQVKNDLEPMERFQIIPFVSWSQDGEDIILSEFASEKSRYIDVGAHHPFKYSVTKRLYDSGWSGINIDITPEIVSEFPKYRSRDINIRSLVGEQSGQITFYHFEEKALGTARKEVAQIHQRDGIKVIREEIMTSVPLSAIVQQHWKSCEIGLLSIDVEGAEMGVLRSHDWVNYPIKRCLVELSTPSFDLQDHEVTTFLNEKGLVPTRVLLRSVLFEQIDSK